MDKIYKIAEQAIDVSQLLYIGQLRPVCSGVINCNLIFQFNSNIELRLLSGYGLPSYHNSKGDYTEEDSEFFKAAKSEVDKLIKYWNDYKQQA